MSTPAQTMGEFMPLFRHPAELTRRDAPADGSEQGLVWARERERTAVRTVGDGERGATP